jgi:septal ring factor EnvC (AmiA/AmiB activator)
VTGAGDSSLETQPADAVATVEDVRTSRRWTIVALVWAIAASAIAIIALVNANDNSSNTPPAQTTQSVSRKEFQDFESQVNDRLDAFSRKLNDTAAQADVQKLDKRLSQVEDDVSQVKGDSRKTNDTVTQMQADIKDLQQRVDDLESQQQTQQQTP